MSTADFHEPESHTPDEEIVAAEVVLERPRIWTALVVPAVTVTAATVASGSLLILGTLMLHPDVLKSLVEQRPHEFAEQIQAFLLTPAGMVVMLLPQGFMLAAALLAAWLSPVALGERLALGRPRLGLGTQLLCVLGMPFMALVGSHSIEFLGGTSEQLEQMGRMFRDMTGGAAVVMVLAIGLLPGLCEELLFRGYMQSRLVQSMPAWLAIFITSVGFACAHVDPIHALGVLPLGIWLGVVAWASNSVWPAVACHVFINLLSVGTTRWTSVEELDDPSVFVVGVVSGAALLAAIVLMVRSRKGVALPRLPVPEMDGA